MKLWTCFAAAFFVLNFVDSPANSEPLGQALGSIAIQDGGRLKPFDTFARESMRLIYGKETYKGKNATEVVFTWLLIPELWHTTPIVEIRHKGLKTALGIADDERYYTVQDLMTNPRVPILFQELQNLRSKQEKLNPYYQAVQRLENQVALFQVIRNGEALRFVPSADSDTWVPVHKLEGETSARFSLVAQEFTRAISMATESAPQSTPEFADAIEKFTASARAVAPEKYADDRRILTEQYFYRFHPFKWAWIAYLVGAILLAWSLSSSRDWVVTGSWIFLGLGFALHTIGMAVRIYLAGRPPVSNMYETVVWVPWGTLIFGFLLARLQQQKLLLLCAGLAAVFCLVLTDLSPAVLDSSLHPLEPVLRSTFWLTTHVLIITISYAAFFLAFVIGDVLLFMFLKDESRFSGSIQAGVQGIYRAIQIGVVLLAAGIILGAIWADYSWGRYWGWDPKETWALIALLGYVAVLHGRLVGWIRGFGMAACSVVAFSLVIMAWYGVNFVLGAGLHSYGFGAGGVEYVAGFVVLHLLYVTYVSTARYARLKNEN